MSTPICPVHNKALRPSRFNDGHFCPTKREDGRWCDGEQHGPAEYRCEECGAELHTDWCSSCRDSEMVVRIDTGMPASAGALHTFTERY